MIEKILILLKRWFKLKEKPRPKSKLKISGDVGKDLPDDRDHKKRIVGNFLPEEVDLRPYVREVKAQGRHQSCVSHVICSAVELQMYQYKAQTFIPLSERFNYYYGRLLCGFKPTENIGMYPRQAIKAAFEYGLSPELLCSYADEMSQEPSHISKIFANPIRQRLKEYYKVDGIEGIKETLASGIPVLASVMTYDYWSNVKRDGLVRADTKTDKEKGYHYILIVGYTKDDKLIFLNSWNLTWGDMGYGYIDFDYTLRDIWVIELE